MATAAQDFAQNQITKLEDMIASASAEIASLKEDPAAKTPGSRAYIGIGVLLNNRSKKATALRKWKEIANAPSAADLENQSIT